jgi:hypothetical protein
MSSEPSDPWGLEDKRHVLRGYLYSRRRCPAASRAEGRSGLLGRHFRLPTDLFTSKSIFPSWTSRDGSPWASVGNMETLSQARLPRRWSNVGRFASKITSHGAMVSTAAFLGLCEVLVSSPSDGAAVITARTGVHGGNRHGIRREVDDREGRPVAKWLWADSKRSALRWAWDKQP